MEAPVLLSKTTMDQRFPLYEDVEDLILTGFLTHTIKIQGVTFALRSLNPGDLLLLRTRAELDFDSEWKVWSIASAIWMLGGYCLLDEIHAAPRLAKTIRGLPESTKELLFSLVTGLFARQGRALEATEAYCYEQVSRFRWNSSGGHPPNMHIGIPGMDRLGTNYVQRMWIYYNQKEDRRVDEDSQWEGFKLVASSMSPKGVQKIDRHEQDQKKAEAERRQKFLDRFYYTRLGLIKPFEAGSKEAPSAIGIGTKTPDELVDEMKRWVAGEDDWHDKVVHDYKSRVSHQYDQEKKERQRRIEALRDQEAELSSSMMPQALVGYTTDQLQRILQHRQPGPSGVKLISNGQNSPREHLYAKYLNREADSGALRVVNGQLVEAPESRLNEQLAQRLVPFQLGPGDEE